MIIPRHHLAWIICFAIAIGLWAPSSPRAEDFTLSAVHQSVVNDYATVRHLTADALAARLKRSRDIILFDVRETDEFAVSHLSGATRVDPGVWRRTFLKRHGDRVKGKTVVFYCSVGVRSSKLAAKLQEALSARGATAVYNLQAGIFNWHNQQRPLTSGTAPTSFVHPFDDHWGQLVARRDLLRYKPGD